MEAFAHGYYTHKGNKYKTLKSGTKDGLVTSKNVFFEIWESSVLYTRVEKELEKVYCRELKEFKEMFTLKQKYLPTI